MVTLIKEPKKP